jgi:tetratricopeptide (TPR) repeat protein
VEELDPVFNVHWYIFNVYVNLGEDSLAVEELQKALLRDSLMPENMNFVKDVLYKSDMKGILNWAIDFELKDSEPSPLSLATWYAMLDQREEALKWLEKALEEKIPNIIRINNNPDYDNLRSEPRFQAIIKKMGLSEYANRE